MGGAVSAVTGKVESAVSGLKKSAFGDTAAPGQAAELQAKAMREGIAEQRRQFDITQQQLQPFQAAEVEALNQQRALMGLGGQAAQQQAMAMLQESPGQKFIRQRQQKALLRGAAATGGLGGGNVLTALQEQAAGFAQQDLQNRMAQLQALGGGTTRTLAGMRGQFGQQQAASLRGIGEAQASGILGAQQMRAQRTGQLAQMGGMIFSDERLKTDIQDLKDPKACYDAVIKMPLKVWRYLEETGLDQNMHFGTMAHEAPEQVEVKEIDGYKLINIHDELMLIAGAIQYMHAQNEQGADYAIG